MSHLFQRIVQLPRIDSSSTLCVLLGDRALSCLDPMTLQPRCPTIGFLPEIINESIVSLSDNLISVSQRGQIEADPSLLVPGDASQRDHPSDTDDSDSSEESEGEYHSDFVTTNDLSSKSAVSQIYHDGELHFLNSVQGAHGQESRLLFFEFAEDKIRVVDPHAGRKCGKIRLQGRISSLHVVPEWMDNGVFAGGQSANLLQFDMVKLEKTRDLGGRRRVKGRERRESSLSIRSIAHDLSHEVLYGSSNRSVFRFPVASSSTSTATRSKTLTTRLSGCSVDLMYLEESCKLIVGLQPEILRFGTSETRRNEFSCLIVVSDTVE